MNTPFISPSILRLATTSIWASAITISISCKETSAPPAAPASPTPMLSAASPTSISGVVATDLEPIPTVFVHDSVGRPLPGIDVVFQLTTSNSTLNSTVARSTVDGLASPSGWKFGTMVGEQFVIATVGHQTVMFLARVVPGPAVTFAKLAGDDQQAAFGARVNPPQVQLLDAYANPIAGMTVNFAIEAGGGSVTGESSTTNLEGVATLGSWTLGFTEDQRLVASAGSLTPVTFHATAYDPQGPCYLAPSLSAATVRQSTLTDAACRTADGRFLDIYSITVPQEGVLNLKLTSSAFHTRLELRDEKGTPIASNRTDQSTNDSEIKAILPASRITVVITSVAPGATGAYEISYTIGGTSADGCEISIARGISTGSVVGAPDHCTPKDGLAVDRYRIYLTAGSSLSLFLSDYSLSDNRFELQDDRGGTLAVGVAKNYVESTLDFTAPVSGYYVILVQVYEQYSLTVR